MKLSLPYTIFTKKMLKYLLTFGIITTFAAFRGMRSLKKAPHFILK